MMEPGKQRGEFTDADLSAILSSLRVTSEDELSPAPGFYARLMDRIESQQTRSIWSVFLEPVFGTRFALVSAALMALLAVTLLTGGPIESAQEEATFAVQQQHNSLAVAQPVALTEDGHIVGAPIYQPLHEMEESTGRDVVLADLASYRGH